MGFMAHVTCVVVYADGTPCPNRRKYASGWCTSCYSWSRANGDRDPQGRQPRGRLQSAVCLVTFANGTPCGRNARYAPGWCVNCWKWSREHGRSPDGRPYVRTDGELLPALRAAARAAGNGCVILNGLGYRWTTALVSGRQINAARAVWMLAHGDPGEAFVLHTCHRGEEGCISIRHLYLGDNARNMADMVEAGRATKANRGELSAVAKLTREDVHAIRERYVKGARYPHPGSARAIAGEYGIGAGYISVLAAGDRWAWLDAANGQEHVTTCTAHTWHVVPTR